MKQSPQETELLKRLGPSKFSSAGFLGYDNRTVSDIIAADHAVLENLGVTKDEMVHALESRYEQARSALGAIVEVRSGVTAVYHESRGRLPSPFPGEGVFEKGQVTLKQGSSGKSLVITPLSVHLIKKHGFFQGRGAPFRIDPELAVELLGLGL